MSTPRQVAYLGSYRSIGDFDQWMHPGALAHQKSNNFCFFRLDKAEDNERAALIAPGTTVLAVFGNEFMSCGQLAPVWWTIDSLTTLSIDHYKLFRNEIPPAISGLRNLHTLRATHCMLDCVPGELGRLPSLQYLHLHDNYLYWIPSTLDRPFARLDLGWNWFRKYEDGANRRCADNPPPRELVEAHASELRVFRYEFIEAAIGLQDLELPALVTLEILDALCPNAVRMAAKWDLVVAVKHFRR